MSTGLTQPYATDPHLADTKLPPHEMIEGHTARDQVEADFPAIEVHVIVAPERFDRLALNQGEFEIREWFEKVPCRRA